MSFQVIALNHAEFEPVFGLSESLQRQQGAIPYIADSNPGFPCRVSLRDAEPGETVLLVNYQHLPVDNPYRASHAIFVIDGARTARPAAGEVPDMLARRQLSVRAFDAQHMMTDARVIDGSEARALFRKYLAVDEHSYLQVHNAARGCYMARVERA